MGRIYRDQRTGWWIADYVDAVGKRRRVKASRDPREARRTLALLESKAIRDRALEVRPLKRIGFGEYAEVFLKHVRSQLRAWDRYECALRSLKPFFGNVQMTAIDAEWIERYKQARAEQVEPATVNHDLHVLRRMYNLAMEWGYARESPVRFVKFFRERNARLRYLTREEFDRLVEACPDWLRALITVAVHTGMRRGELLALTWVDVDLENGFASVNDPKNATPRKVPLNETAREILTALKSNSKSMRVFSNEVGERISHEHLRMNCHRVLAVAKIEDFRFHDLRHTCGSWMAMAGVDIRRIQEVLGHKTISMTLRYAHLAPNQAADAVGKLDKFTRSHRGAATT